MHDGDLHLFLVTDDHLENVVAHNWGMTALLVPGTYPSTAEAPREALDLVGDRPDLEEIASYLPAANAQALVDAQSATGDDAVHAVVAALGLPDAIAHFLLGTVPLAEVEGTSLHYARGISNAIGRSVDIMLAGQTREQRVFAETYKKIVRDKPWMIGAMAALGGSIGAGLLISAIKAPAPRSTGRLIAGVCGGLMLTDACVQMIVAAVVRSRLAEND